MSLRVDILTLFPELIEPFLGGSLLGAGVREGHLAIGLTNIRDFSTDRHRSVDDAPYGGGDGMVLKCEPTVAAIEAVCGEDGRILALSPRGRRLTQSLVEELSQEAHLVLVCGRYAGFDQRILDETGAEELSIGDYVLSGGEAAALVVTEAVARLLPGVLGNPDSADRDSFSEDLDGFLEHDLYTRPPEFRGRQVPDVLLSGDHAQIERYRAEQARELTRKRRPDLLERRKQDKHGENQ